MTGTAAVPFQQQNNSIVIVAQVNGVPVNMTLDTGDAIGPVFDAQTASKLGLVKGPPIQVGGAGGTTTLFETTATIAVGLGRNVVFKAEPGAIDDALPAGFCLIGLPFFQRTCRRMDIDFQNGELILEIPAASLIP